MNVIGKKSRFKQNNREEALQKESTRNNAEYIGFVENTTKIDDSITKVLNM